MTTSGRRSTGSDARAEMVSRALELRDAGHADWLERACAGRPELTDEVRTAVEAAVGLPSLLLESVGTDRRVGTEVAARYQITQRLGAGAMGVVYEADDDELSRKVALKVLRPGMLDQERAIGRFEREAKAMAAVTHPSVIAIHDRGRTDDGEAFIVMELLDGLPLGQIIERLAAEAGDPSSVDGRLVSEHLGIDTHGESSWVRVAARWVAELASGVVETHAADVVHRDIKPSNVIVRRDGRPVLLDFGIALLGDDSVLTRGGSSLGTPAYMPPEAVAAERRVTASGDVYGLAAVLYCLLTLRAPYSGTPAEVLAALSTREPVPPAKLHAGLPRDLQAIVEKGMSRRVSQRYETAEELERDLRAFLDHRPVVARPIGPVQRVARRLRRSRAAMGAAVALVVVGAVLVGRAIWADVIEGRQASLLQIEKHYPPNFTILNHSNRKYIYEEDRAAVEALLDEAAEVCVDVLPTYVLRASFRLDHGDPRGAAEDMAVIARREGTAFARALAAAYAALPEGASSSKDVDLSGLPEPVTARDRYLRAYHHIREFEDPEALALIDDEVREAVPHAEELEFATVFFTGMEADERIDGASALHVAVERYVERVGVRSATTEHYIGYALSHANRFAEAIGHCRLSVELAPRTHVNRTNAGYVAFTLGRTEEARELLRVALEVRPNDFKPAEHLLWTYVREQNYDMARGIIEDVAPKLEGVSSWWQPYISGAVETYRALDAFHALNEAEDRGDVVESIVIDDLSSAIETSREHFDRARALGASVPTAFAESIVDAIEGGDREALRDALVDWSLVDLRQWWRLELVERHLPPNTPESIRDLVRRFKDEVSTARLSSSSDR